MNMGWRSMSKREAEVISSQWKSMPQDIGDKYLIEYVPSKKLPPEYREMRNRLKSMYDNSFLASHNKIDYFFDLNFGMQLYTYLSIELEMTPVEAAQDQYWIYIQMEVVPDIIYRRYPPKPENPLINDKRFWKNSWRLYLKTLWWYIYLSWSGSEEKTLKVLSHSEDISQLVERSGRGGFRVDTTRAIMLALSRVEEIHHDSRLLGRVLKLHSSYCAMMEPELMDCSLEEYAEKLFADLGVPLNE